MVSRTTVLTSVAALTALMVVLISAGFLLKPSSQQIVPQEQNIGFTSGPDSFLQAGGKSAIILQVAPKFVNLTRGESVTVNVNIEHRGGANGFSTLHVVPSGVQGNLGLPSSATSMTPEQRTELIKAGKQVPGTIDLSQFVKYSMPSIAINSGEVKSLQMTITIPKDLPDEMIGKSIHFDPDLIISEMQNVSPDRASDARVFSDIVTVTIAG